MVAVNDLPEQDRLEVPYRWDYEEQLLHIEGVLCCGTVQRVVDLVEKGRRFEHAGKATYVA